MGHAKQQKINRRSGSASERTRANTRVAYSDYRFVRIELTEQEKQQFRDLLAAGEFESLSVTDFVREGYKLSFSEGDEGHTVICSVSQPHADHHNAGLILTGRGGDAETALAVVAFKHVYLCEDTLWRSAEDNRGGSYNDIG